MHSMLPPFQLTSTHSTIAWHLARATLRCELGKRRNTVDNTRISHRTRTILCPLIQILTIQCHGRTSQRYCNARAPARSLFQEITCGRAPTFRLQLPPPAFSTGDAQRALLCGQVPARTELAAVTFRMSFFRYWVPHVCVRQRHIPCKATQRFFRTCIRKYIFGTLPPPSPTHPCTHLAEERFRAHPRGSVWSSGASVSRYQVALSQAHDGWSS